MYAQITHGKLIRTKKIEKFDTNSRILLFVVKDKEYHQQVPLRGNLGVIKQAYGEHKNSLTLDKKTKNLYIFEGKHALMYSEGFLPSLKELVMTIHICICIF
jgi:hypothetical protein